MRDKQKAKGTPPPKAEDRAEAAKPQGAPPAPKATKSPMVTNLSPDTSAPRLVRTPDGSIYALEGGVRRAITSGLLAAAIVEAFGVPAPIDPADMAQLGVGPDVDVLALDDGVPFVVIGGRRHKLRNFPMPHRVNPGDVKHFPKAPPIDVAAANVARYQYRRALSGRHQLGRAKAAGPAGVARAAGRRVKRRFRR